MTDCFDIPSPMASNSNKYEVFEAWLRENGAQFDMLELREYDTRETGQEGEEKKEEEKKDPSGVVGVDDSSENSSGGVVVGNSKDEDSEMRGIHARVTIPPNSVCVAVPRKCLITVEMGQATPIGQAILHSDLDLDAPKHIFLMIYLLWDRKVNGPRSFFAPYYNILPSTLRNMPIFWSQEELAYLEGSHLLEQIADRNEAIAEDYHSICEIAPELQEIATLEEFKWARMCVCSRNFGLQIDGHRTSALVPHADMLNHFRPRETKWTFDDERQAFTITTLQTIPAGAQVYDSYGQKCNHRFLLNYGFAVEDNREVDGFCPNEVPIELSVSPDDPLYETKLDFWTRGESFASNSLAAAVAAVARNPSASSAALAAAVEAATGGCGSGGGGHNSNITIHSNSSSTFIQPLVKRIRICVSNNENTRHLLSMLRALVCNEVELRMVMNAPPNDGVTRSFLGLTSERNSSFCRTCRDIRHPLSLRNERAAMNLLLDIVFKALSQYPTPLRQDRTDLLDERSYPLFSNKRHAKVQVRGEKEVLHHYANWARTALEVMDVIEAEVEAAKGELERRPNMAHMLREMEEGEGQHHTILRYCNDVLGVLRREELKQVEMIKARSGFGYL